MMLVERADAFAAAAHASVGQTRKYSGEPYIVHPRQVRKLLLSLSSQPVTEAQQAAALLHDTREDCGISDAQIRSEFGDEVADLVDWLTDISCPEDGNRRARKLKDLAHTAVAPVAAKNIKICDCISNAPSITAHDPGFARKWLAEKAAILEVCSDADPALLREAHRVLTTCVNQLKHNNL
jgi:guanosine-3',5'-bis(diphosphate) 3'-pyrophosphohydrolase